MARRIEKRNVKKPVIVICSEGGKKSTEYLYFRNFASRNLRIQFSTGNSTDPKGMLNDLLKYINNEDIKNEDFYKIFLVLDTDLDERRINEIKLIKKECDKHNIEIITSAPTFEIWFLMHYRKKNLIFKTSKDVKKELQNINGVYKETMDMYNVIKDLTNDAKNTAKSFRQQAEKNNEDLLTSNPHTNVYKILEAIDEFKKI